MQETFSVPDISCEHCKRSIEGALEPLSGVSRATVHIGQKEVDVEWDPASVSRTDVVNAIGEAGYEVSA